MKNRINRKQYEKIRKMDHQQMAAYFNDVYNEGLVEGIARAPNIGFFPDEAERMLRQIKGIGNRKVKDVMHVLAVCFQEGDGRIE